MKACDEDMVLFFFFYTVANLYKVPRPMLFPTTSMFLVSANKMYGSCGSLQERVLKKNGRRRRYLQHLITIVKKTSKKNQSIQRTEMKIVV